MKVLRSHGVTTINETELIAFPSRVKKAQGFGDSKPYFGGGFLMCYVSVQLMSVHIQQGLVCVKGLD